MATKNEAVPAGTGFIGFIENNGARCIQARFDDGVVVNIASTGASKYQTFKAFVPGEWDRKIDDFAGRGYQLVALQEFLCDAPREMRIDSEGDYYALVGAR